MMIMVKTSFKMYLYNNVDDDRLEAATDSIFKFNFLTFSNSFSPALSLSHYELFCGAAVLI